MHDDLARYWAEMNQLTAAMPIVGMAEAAAILNACRRQRATIFVIGNGGSAATASHFACDLAKGTRVDGRTSFRVVPLTDNAPLLTAWANDVSFEHVFAEQLAPLVRRDDVLVAISASGNSANILAAARVARHAGATTIAFTGRSGGRLRHLADLVIGVPSDRIEQVEDAHLLVAHSLCVALRGEIAAEAAAQTLVLNALDDSIVANPE